MRLKVLVLVLAFSNFSFGEEMKLKISASTQEITFDPTLALGYQQFVLMGLFHDSLVRVGANGDIEGKIARKWSFGSDRVEFQIDERARFHDGRPVEATDVVFSLCRHLTSNSAFKTALLSFLKESGGKNQPACGSIRAIGTRKIEIRLRGPYPPLFELLGKAGLAILPRDFDPARPVGAGPYRLAGDFDKGKAQLKLWREYPFEKPQPTAFEISINADPYKAIEVVKSGEVDLVLGAPVEAIDELDLKDYEVHPSNTLTVTNMFFNTKTSWLNTKPKRGRLYRWLLGQVLNDQSFFSSLDRPSHSIVPMGMMNPLFYSDSKAIYAKIDSTVLPMKGKTVRIVTPRGLFKTKFLERLRSAFESAGAKVALVSEKGRPFLNPILEGHFDLAFIPYLSLSADPDGFLSLLDPQGVLGAVPMGSEDLFRSIAGCRFTDDRKSRLKLYAKHLLNFQEKMTVVPFAQQNLPIIIRKGLGADGLLYAFHIDLRSITKKKAD